MLLKNVCGGGGSLQIIHYKRRKAEKKSMSRHISNKEKSAQYQDHYLKKSPALTSNGKT